MEIEIIVLLLFLLAGSLGDLRSRTISVKLCMGGLAAIISAGVVKGDITMARILGGIVVGICLIGIGKLTKGQIGAGDGMVFVITGIGLGIWNNLLLLYEALLLSFFWSLIFLAIKKIDLKTRLPFLPFVFVAFVLEFVLKI